MMNIEVDKYIDIDTNMHQWNPRTKFVGIMILIFSFSYIRSVKLIPFMMLISGGMFLASKLPFKILLKRLKISSFFIISMALFLLVFSQGKTILTLGWITITMEGLEAAVMILGRIYCILTLGVVLFETVPFLTMLKVMNSLGLPDILSDMILFTYRYLFQLAEDLSSMQTSMRLRGFKGKRVKDIIGLTSLIATIFIRSYEQSERIYHAMILRGYSNNIKVIESFKAKKKDLLFTLITIMLAALIVFFQIYIDIGRI